MSLGPQGSWQPPHSIWGAPGSTLGFHIVHKADLAFFLLVRPHPSLLGLGNGSLEEPKVPRLGSPPSNVGGWEV